MRPSWEGGKRVYHGEPTILNIRPRKIHLTRLRDFSVAYTESQILSQIRFPPNNANDFELVLSLGVERLLIGRNQDNTGWVLKATGTKLIQEGRGRITRITIRSPTNFHDVGSRDLPPGFSEMDVSLAFLEILSQHMKDNITEIHLHLEEYFSEEAVQLAQIVNSFTSLKNLRHTNVDTLPRCFGKFLEGIKTNKSIEHLDIFKNHLYTQSLTHLCDLIRDGNVRRVDVSGCYVDDTMAYDLIDAVCAAGDKINSLNLDGCLFTSELTVYYALNKFRSGECHSLEITFNLSEGELTYYNNDVLQFRERNAQSIIDRAHWAEGSIHPAKMCDVLSRLSWDTKFIIEELVEHKNNNFNSFATGNGMACINTACKRTTHTSYKPFLDSLEE
jgi:hypothetical protein